MTEPQADVPAPSEDAERGPGAAVSRWFWQQAVWFQVLLVWSASRAVGYLITARVAVFQPGGTWTPKSPTYTQFAGLYWDATWYRTVTEQGYPVPLPVGPTGEAVQSAWAFFPGFPLLVRAVMRLTGLPYVAAGQMVALACGLAAAYVLYALACERTTPRTAMAAVAIFSFFPTAVVMQYAYSESLAMLALLAAILLLHRRSYLAAVAPAVVFGLTRPIALPFALVPLAHLAVRRRAHRRGDERLPLGDVLSLATLTAASGAAAVAFPLYCGWRTGAWDNYNRVQQSWHGEKLSLLTPWFKASRWVLGDIQGPLILAGLVVVFGYSLWVSRCLLGVEMLAWSVGYGLYLLVVVQPFTPVFRYLLPLFPLALVAASAVKNRAHLFTWVFAFASLQVVWVSWLWRIKAPDFPP